MFNADTLWFLALTWPWLLALGWLWSWLRREQQQDNEEAWPEPDEALLRQLHGHYANADA